MRSFSHWTNLGWDWFFSVRLCLAVRILISFVIAVSAYLIASQLSSTGGFTSITIVSVIAISFLLEAKLSLAFAFVLSLTVDYFLIPPLGGIFASQASVEHFFAVCGASLLAAFFVSSLRHAFGHLSRARQEAVEAKTRAEQASEQMEKMLALVSHDVRNPLAASKMSIQLLLENPLRANRQSLLGIISRNLDRADSLIQSLLDVSSIRMGQPIALQYRYYNLSADIRDLVEEMKQTLDSRLQFAGQHCAWGLWGREGIRRALENLIGNAIKYGNSESPITISVSNSDQNVQISVHNDGNEIDPADQNSVFDYFHRGRAKSTSLKGWGLGLALVKCIAEAHGGSAKVESGQGRGTKFSLILPMQRAQSQPVSTSTAL